MALMVTIIGTVGLCFVLTAFILENFGLFQNRPRCFNIMTLTGSLFLIYYSWVLGSWIFIILNMVWIAFAVYFLIKGK